MATLKPYSAVSPMTYLLVVVHVNNDLWERLLVFDDNTKNVVTANLSSKCSNEQNFVHLSSKDSASGDNINVTNQLEDLKITKAVTELSSLKCQFPLLLDIQKHNGHKLVELCMNGYYFSYFINYLKHSKCYRGNVVTNLWHCSEMKTPTEDLLPYVQVNLLTHYIDIIDFKWNERIDRMLLERRELDHAMSWFSTLGGAFSALGDEFEHCAEKAGKISIHQMHIALHLGDPLTVARCKLYLALSLMQRGHLKAARTIIEAQFFLAQHSSVNDERLVRMCYGVWAKLKFMYQLKCTNKVL